MNTMKKWVDCLFYIIKWIQQSQLLTYSTPFPTQEKQTMNNQHRQTFLSDSVSKYFIFSSTTSLDNFKCYQSFKS